MATKYFTFLSYKSKADIENPKFTRLSDYDNADTAEKQRIWGSNP